MKHTRLIRQTMPPNTYATDGASPNACLLISMKEKHTVVINSAGMRVIMYGLCC